MCGPMMSANPCNPSGRVELVSPATCMGSSSRTSFGRNLRSREADRYGKQVRAFKRILLARIFLRTGASGLRKWTTSLAQEELGSASSVQLRYSEVAASTQSSDHTGDPANKVDPRKNIYRRATLGKAALPAASVAAPSESWWPQCMFSSGEYTPETPCKAASSASITVPRGLSSSFRGQKAVSGPPKTCRFPPSGSPGCQASLASLASAPLVLGDTGD